MGRFSYFVTGLGLLAVAAASACGGGGGPTNPSPPGASFASQIQPIFDAKCVTCHAPGIYGFTNTGGVTNNGLNLVAGSSHRSLVDQPTFQSPDVQPSLRVQPGNPDGSYLMHKVTSDSPKSGERMPLDGPPFLSDAEIRLIRDWIARGAPND